MDEQEIIKLGIVGIKNMGEYDSQTNYKKLNVVTYQGSSYCALKDTVGNLPTNAEYWQLYAQKGDVGPQGPKPIKGTDYFTGEDISSIENDLKPVIKSDVQEEVITQVGNISNGSPLPANSLSDMTDTTRLYVLLTDGYVYYYDGDSWEQGWLYQSTIDNDLITTYLNLKSSIEDLDASINKYNYNSIHNINNYFYNSSGVKTSDNSSIISHPIYVEKNKTYKYPYSNAISSTLRKYVTYIKEDGTLETPFQGTVVDTYNTFVAPKNGYVVINVGKASSPNVMFCESSLYPETYTAFSIKNNDMKINYENIVDNPIPNELIIQKSINLFDKNSSLNRTGMYTLNNTYDESYTSFGVSHPIFLEKNDIIKFNSSYAAFGTNRKLARININTLDVIEMYTFAREDDIGTFTIPMTGYYSICYSKASIDNVMVVKNTNMPSTYTPYKCEMFNVNINKNESKLFNKSITLNGDSICAGVGDAIGGYGKIIADNFNMLYENVSVAGATITANQYSRGGVLRHCISTSITDMNENYEYAIIEGGVNDSSLNIPLGSITNGYDDNFNTETYIGAFENMLKNLVTRFAGKKYGYIAVHQMSNNYRITNNENTSYYWAAKKCCEKWGVPFLDLNDKVPPFAFLINTSLSSLPTTYTHNGDGWHPNELGYKKYYVDKIINWLESL